MIQTVSEGKGEVQAFPLLLRRLVAELGVYDVPVAGQARICPKNKMTQEENEFKRFIQLSRFDPKIQAVVFLFDADDNCARDYVPQMRLWAAEVAPDFSCAIVMVRREYEAWFLSSLPSLRGKRGIPLNALYEGNPEEKSGAKEALRRYVPNYRPTSHQTAFSAEMDLGEAYRAATSFRKLVQELCRVLRELGYEPMIPAHWDAKEADDKPRKRGRRTNRI